MNIKEAAGFLAGKDNILILTHSRPDGDTLCSAGALAYGLNKLGKRAFVLKNPEAAERYLRYTEKYFAPEGFEPECIVSVDTARESMITLGGEQYADRVELAIDHHGSNSRYAEYSCIDPNAAACSEMIYDICIALGIDLDPELAGLLYIASATDTGCFMYTNTSARTLEIVSKLVAAGAPNGRINKELFRTKKRGIVLLEGEIISNMVFSHDDEIAVAVITRKMMENYGVVEAELEDIAALPAQIEGVKIGITVKEQPDGRSKVSVRTVDGVSANELCAKFEGGGHPCAAGCTLYHPPEIAADMMVEAAGELL